jgi:hypothetical protein
MTSLTPLWHWVLANPYESLLIIGAILSFINGLLPAKVAAGPVGKAILGVLDRLSVLTRTDAPGTLKWPVIGTSILQPGGSPPAPTQESSK